MFKSLTIHGWRQFRNVEIDFHPRLTVLTGANGAGKSTLLNLASRHFGWTSQFISTPKKRGQNAILFYSTDFWELDDPIESIEDLDDATHAPAQGPRQSIGKIVYQNGSESNLEIPTSHNAAAYDVIVPTQQAVEGLHIPSHRSTYTHQQVQSIPTVPRRRIEAFQAYTSIIRARVAGQHTQWSPQYYMKETLIGLATFGYGNEAVDADQESARIFEAFQDVLRRMLPPKLGFRKLVVRVPEIILETASGPFSIDAVSGGVAAIIDLAWQVFMYQPTGSSFVVTLDEPENHLHPELQRRVLADLLAAFPSVQFIVATHSPFIVGSVSKSNVYVLDYDETKKVNSTLLDTQNKVGTANEILRNVLGLEFTMPIWVESELGDLIQKYSAKDFSNETMTELRAEMASLGLDKHIPQTIAQLAELKGAQ